MDDLSPHTGLTPNEVAKLLRVSPDKVRDWIRSGALQAVNVAGSRSGRPRFVVLPQALNAFIVRNAAHEVKPVKKTKRMTKVDYYPD